MYTANLQPKCTKYSCIPGGSQVNRTTTHLLRDWSLITGGGGGLQNGKIAGPKLFAPPLQDRVKLFAPPILNSGHFLLLSCNPYG